MQRQVFTELAKTNDEARRRNQAPISPATLIESWTARRALLARQLQLLESGDMLTGNNILGNMVEEDKARIGTWIAELDALIAEHSK